MLRATQKVFVAAGIVALAAACTDPVDVNIVAIDVVGDVLVSQSDPATFEVTAVNQTNERVVWGMGSSSCQLSLLLQLTLVERRLINHRGCTDDLVEQGLDPGESRTEAFTWDGTVLSGGSLVALQPGRYHVIGVAGEKYASALLAVTVVVP
jgi:hypothetical protein